MIMVRGMNCLALQPNFGLGTRVSQAGRQKPDLGQLKISIGVSGSAGTLNSIRTVKFM